MKPRSALDMSYRLACVVALLLLSAIWWVGLIDVCNAFWRLLVSAHLHLAPAHDIGVYGGYRAYVAAGRFHALVFP